MDNTTKSIVFYMVIIDINLLGIGLSQYHNDYTLLWILAIMNSFVMIASFINLFNRIPTGNES